MKRNNPTVQTNRSMTSDASNSPHRLKNQRSMVKKQPGERTDILSNMRKLSSTAFPLMGNSDQPKLTKNDVYDFENKLRDIIAELTKPIYDK